MSKLIIVRAQQQSGKTTTVGMVYQELLKSSITEHEFDKRIVEKDSLRFNSQGETIDFIAIITLKNGLRIGIISEGDIANFVRDKLHYILEKNIDFIICSARSQNRKGSVYRMIVDDFSKEHQIVSEIFTKYSDKFEGKFVIKQMTVSQIVNVILR
jgi:hypothetical protein